MVLLVQAFYDAFMFVYYVCRGTKITASDVETSEEHNKPIKGYVHLVFCQIINFSLKQFL